MVSSFKEKTFKLWEYRVSHGSLLIRSPREREGLGENIDIICVGVEYISIPWILRGVELSEPTAEELGSLGNILDKEVASEEVLVLVSQGRRFFVVTSYFKVDKNHDDIMESPFEKGFKEIGLNVSK